VPLRVSPADVARAQPGHAAVRSRQRGRGPHRAARAAGDRRRRHVRGGRHGASGPPRALRRISRRGPPCRPCAAAIQELHLGRSEEVSAAASRRSPPTRAGRCRGARVRRALRPRRRDRAGGVQRRGACRSGRVDPRGDSARAAQRRRGPGARHAARAVGAPGGSRGRARSGAFRVLRGRGGCRAARGPADRCAACGAAGRSAARGAARGRSPTGPAVVHRRGLRLRMTPRRSLRLP